MNKIYPYIYIYPTYIMSVAEAMWKTTIFLLLIQPSNLRRPGAASRAGLLLRDSLGGPASHVRHVAGWKNHQQK